MLNVYLCGQKYFGQEVFKLLLSMGHRIVGVSSPAYRLERIKFSPVHDELPDRLRSIAEQERVPWREAGTLNSKTLPDGVDLIVAAHSHDFISQATRTRTRYGALGYHPSLLPLHRGRDAVRWVIKLRERVTGGSVYWFTETVDGGPVAAQDWCFVRPDDTAEELWRRELQPMGLRLLKQVIDEVDEGVIVSVPQDEELATWEPALNPPGLFRPDLLMLPDKRSSGGPTYVASAAEARELRHKRPVGQGG